MPLIPYTLLSLVGSAVWAFALAGVGWGLGSRYAHLDHGFHFAEYSIVAIIAGSIVAIVLRVVRQDHSAARRFQ